MTQANTLPEHLNDLALQLVSECGEHHIPEFVLSSRHGAKCQYKDPAHLDCDCKKSLYVGRTPLSDDHRVGTYTRSREQAESWVGLMKKMFDPEKRELMLLRQQAKVKALKKVTIEFALRAWITDRETRKPAWNTMKLWYTTAGLARSSKPGGPPKVGLLQFAKKHGYEFVHQLGTEQLTIFRNGWTNEGLSMLIKQCNLVNFFSFCVRMGWLEENPAGGLTNPNRGLTPVVVKDTVPDPGFTQDEYQQVLAACDRYPVLHEHADKDVPFHVRVLCELLRWSGFAPVDALKLRWEELGPNGELGHGRKMVRRRKNGKRTGGVLPEHVLALLMEVKHHRPVRGAHPDYIFSTGEVSPHADTNLYRKWWDRIRTVFGLVEPKLEISNSEGEIVEPHPYLFRHTFAIESLEAGGDIHDLAKLMGNTVKEIEKSYVDYSPTLRAAILERQRKTFAAQGAPQPPAPAVEHPHRSSKVLSFKRAEAHGPAAASRA